MSSTPNILLTANKRISGIFYYCLFLMSHVVYSTEQAATAQPTVAHTEYAATHDHGDLRIVKVKSPSSRPFASLFQLYEFEFVPYTQKEVGADGRYAQDIWSDAGADIYLLYTSHEFYYYDRRVFSGGYHSESALLQWIKESKSPAELANNFGKRRLNYLLTNRVLLLEGLSNLLTNDEKLMWNDFQSLFLTEESSYGNYTIWKLKDPTYAA